MDQASTARVTCDVGHMEYGTIQFSQYASTTRSVPHRITARSTVLYGTEYGPDGVSMVRSTVCVPVADRYHDVPRLHKRDRNVYSTFN